MGRFFPCAILAACSLLATRVNAVGADFYAAHGCSFYVKSANQGGEFGCTSLDGEQPLSARLTSPPAESCILSLFSDASCNSPVAVIDTSAACKSNVAKLRVVY